MKLQQIVERHREEVLSRWLLAQRSTRTGQLMSSKDLEQQCRNFINTLINSPSRDGEVAAELNDVAVDLSRTRAIQGFSPAETAAFILSLKESVLPALEEDLRGDPRDLAEEIRDGNRFLDLVAMRTFEAYVQTREELIRQQASAIGELSTPVVEVWDGILLIPLIGVVDTERSKQIMESLLTKIVETSSSVVLIDITGVAVVDTAVAKHLLQTIQAIKLLGAEGIICGIAPRVAQTLVHLGVDLGNVVTRATLAKGLKLALAKNSPAHESRSKKPIPRAVGEADGIG